MKNIDGIEYCNLRECHEEYGFLTRVTLLKYIGKNKELVAKGENPVFPYPTVICGHMHYSKADLIKIEQIRKSLPFGYFKKTKEVKA